MTTTISIKNLQKTYTSKKQKGSNVAAVKGINLEVASGKIFGFLGPNGAGKSTTQRMLTTLLAIDAGSVTIAGYDIATEPAKVRAHIGYVSQLGGADLTATGRQNLLLQGQLYGLKKAEVQAKIPEIAAMFDLTELLDRPVPTYSGGQRRRLEIALGIINRPDILFLDEPSTGLDPQNRAALGDYIKLLQQRGMTIFLTTHYLDEADSLCDRLAIIDHGEIVAQGTPQALKEEISGDVVTLATTDNARALALLTKQDFVISSQQTTSELTLYVHNGAASVPKIVDLLNKAEIKVSTIATSAPSLNDVFLQKTGRALRDAS